MTASSLAASVLYTRSAWSAAGEGLVRRHDDDTHRVDLAEFRLLGLRRTGHAGEDVVLAEVVLQRDRREGLVLLLDLHALLGLDRLVQPLGVAAAVEDAAGELVDDVDLAVLDDVLVVPRVQLLGPQRVLQVLDQRSVHALVQVLDVEQLLDAGDALLGDGDRALGLVDLVVLVTLQPRHHPVREDLVPLGREVGGPRDDQRCPRLVDEDRVDLVDDGVVVAALGLLSGVEHHVVAQEIEAELVVRAVGDVCGVGGALLLARLLGVHEADREPEEPVDPAHPLGVAAGEVGVHRDDVHPLAGQRP